LTADYTDLHGLAWNFTPFFILLVLVYFFGKPISRRDIVKKWQIKSLGLERIDSSSRRATLAAAVPMQRSGIGSPTPGGQQQTQSRRGYEAMRPEHFNKKRATQS